MLVQYVFMMTYLLKRYHLNQSPLYAKKYFNHLVNSIIPQSQAKAIMLLAGNGSPMPQAFSPPQPHQQVIHHARASVDSSSAMAPTFMPTVSYLSPEALSSTNGLGAAMATRGFTSTYHNNQTHASNINCSMAVSCSTNVMPQTGKIEVLITKKEKKKKRSAYDIHDAKFA